MPERAPGVRCEYCGERNRPNVRRCRFCGEALYEDDEDDFEDEGEGPRRRRDEEDDEPNEAVQWLVPVNRSGWAIAAGYLGLLSCFPALGLAFAIGAVVTGILALREIKRRPRLGGTGRAIFGIVMGGILMLFQAVLVVVLIIGVIQGKH